jgi:hypothetical protein
MGGTYSAHEGGKKRIITKYIQKIPLGRWEDNIKMHLTGIGCVNVNMIHLAQYKIL